MCGAESAALWTQGRRGPMPHREKRPAGQDCPIWAHWPHRRPSTRHLSRKLAMRARCSLGFGSGPRVLGIPVYRSEGVGGPALPADPGAEPESVEWTVDEMNQLQDPAGIQGTAGGAGRVGNPRRLSVWWGEAGFLLHRFGALPPCSPGAPALNRPLGEPHVLMHVGSQRRPQPANLGPVTITLCLKSLPTCALTSNRRESWNFLKDCPRGYSPRVVRIESLFFSWINY